MKNPGLEELREILKDDRLLMEFGTIEKLEIAKDRSVVRARVLLFPDNIEIVARLTWDSVGPNSGHFNLPAVGDLVVVGFIDGHEDEALVLRSLSSKVDLIPIRATEGHFVSRALAGKKYFLVSDTEINLVRGDDPGDEQLVLGNTFKTAYSEHLDIDARHQHIGNLGYNTFVPNEASEYLAIKASPVDDSEMLSDVSKTEK